MNVQPVQQALAGGRALVVATGGDELIRARFCESLRRASAPNTFVSHVVAPVFCDEDLVERLLRDFGVVSDDEMRSRQRAGVGLQHLAEALHRFLVSLVPIKARALLILEGVDDAGPVLDYVRFLATLQADGQPLLEIVLVGSAEFARTLATPELSGLNERVTLRHALPRVSVGQLLRSRVSLGAVVATVVVAAVLAAGAAAAVYAQFAF